MQDDVIDVVLQAVERTSLLLRASRAFTARMMPTSAPPQPLYVDLVQDVLDCVMRHGVILDSEYTAGTAPTFAQCILARSLRLVASRSDVAAVGDIAVISNNAPPATHVGSVVATDATRGVLVDRCETWGTCTQSWRVATTSVVDAAGELIDTAPRTAPVLRRENAVCRDIPADAPEASVPAPEALADARADVSAATPEAEDMVQVVSAEQPPEPLVPPHHAEFSLIQRYAQRDR